VYASYGAFDTATNEFALGIRTNALFLPNYLDLGYQICTRADPESAGKMLDAITALELPVDVRRQLESDWRFIELHHVSIRPYSLRE